MLSMLTGHGGPGDSMWEALGTPDPHKMTPDPNEMQAKMAAAQYVRHADLVAIESRIYDLSDEQETTQYCKDREYLFVGVSMNTHFLLDHDKQFINDPDKPRWVVHMEWAVFELTEDAVEPVAEQEK